MKFILWLITLGAIAFVLFDVTHPENPANALLMRQIATTEISGLDPGRFQRSLVINRVNANSVTFDLEYRGAVERVDAALDSIAIVRDVLGALVKSGRHPSTEGIQVFVYARQTGLRGETGAALVRSLGYGYYDSVRDRVDYEPPK